MSSERQMRQHSRDFLHDTLAMVQSLQVFGSVMSSMKSGFKQFRDQFTLGSKNLYSFGNAVKYMFSGWKPATQLKNIYPPMHFQTKYTQQEQNFFKTLEASKLLRPTTRWSNSPTSMYQERIPFQERFKTHFLKPITQEPKAQWQDLKSFLKTNIPYQKSTAFQTMDPSDQKQYKSAWTKQLLGKSAATATSPLALPGKMMLGTAGAMGNLLTKPFKAVGAVAGGLGTVFGKMAGLKPAQINAMKNGFSGIGKAISGFGWMAIMQLVMGLLAALNPFEPLFQALTDIFSVYGEILSQAFIPLIQLLYNVMLNPQVLAMFQMLSDIFQRIVIAFMPLLDILMPFATIIMMALIIPLQLVLPLIEGLGVILKLLSPLFTGFNDVLLALMGIWNTYIAPIFGALGDLFTWVGSLVQKWLILPLEAFAGAIAWVGSQLEIAKNFFIGLISGLIEGAKGPINAMLSVLNSAITAINSWDTMNWIPDIGTIPLLANGAYVTQPTLAVIGEAGPEYVIPENRMSSAMNKNARTIVVNNYIGNVTEEKLQDLTNQLYRTKFE